MLARTGEYEVAVPDDPLVVRCRAGDIEAFGQVYAEHQERVFRHAYHLLGSYEDAHDACQETFVKAFQAIRSFRGDCTLRAWLLRICTNLCRNQVRARGRRREVSLEQPEEALNRSESFLDPVAHAERSQMAGIVRAALDRLPPAQREIIVLRDLEQLSVAEVAAILRCSPASVPVMLFRARRRLKDLVMRLTREKE